MSRLPIVLCLLSVFPSLCAADAKVLYVAADGSDAWSGTLDSPNAEGTDGPFRTLDRAVSALGGEEGPRVVRIREGRYERRTPLTLKGLKGAGSESPVVVEAHPGEKVHVTGGGLVGGWKKSEDPDLLERLPEEAHGNTYETDLFALGVTDYGVLKERGFGRPVHPAALELFFEDEPMQLARWPNEGYAHIADVPGSATGGRFVFEGDRPQRWRNAADIWLHGLWTWDWADSYTRVKSIDLDRKEIETHPPHGVYGYKKNRRYYALNLIEELDGPGEYYLDRLAGKLYFWPPAPLREGNTTVSLANRLLDIEDCAHLRIRGIVFEQTRGHGATIQGGTDNRIEDCVIRNIGNTGAVIQGGVGNKIVGCEVYNCGDGGVSLSGGDRKTLTPAGHEATDCHIHHYSRWSKTYRPAVAVDGVGNRVAHNHIHDAPHNAIQLGGNRHVIEFNNVHHVCQETADVGAFYMGRDWTQRENVIRYNFFHHLGGWEGRDDAFSHAIAIYLDDWSSGTEIYGNVVFRGGYGVLIGGGRDNLVRNNVFVDCDPSIHIDSRGLGWAKNYFSGETTTLTDRLEAMDYRNPPYSEVYPELLTLYDDDPAVAKYNKVLNNISVGDGKWLHFQDGLDETIVEVRDNWTEGDPGFVNAEEMNFNLRPDSPVFQKGFEAIPFDRIGPRER